MPARGGTASFGAVLELTESSADPGPTGVSLNGAPCNIASAAPATVTPPRPPAGASAESAGMTTRDGKIIGIDGKELYLMGINWFGFDCGATMADGLWGGRDAVAQDFANVVYRIKLLGFNSVRLPFSFRDLYGQSPKWLNTKCTQVPPSVVAAQTKPPGASPTSQPPDPGPEFAQSAAGTCNSYLPSTTTLDRFLWTVDYLTRQGLYVMLDNQARGERWRGVVEGWRRLEKRRKNRRRPPSLPPPSVQPRPDRDPAAVPLGRALDRPGDPADEAVPQGGGDVADRHPERAGRVPGALDARQRQARLR